MRLSLLLLVSILAAFAQAPDPAYEPLTKAYQLLQNKQYDSAITFFLKGIEASPARPDIRKDLAYVYLKVGESEEARDQFAAAMRLDPADFLNDNNSTDFFASLGDLLKPGPTFTNVNDFRAIVVDSP